MQSGDKTLVIDPFSKNIGLAPPSMQADIVLVTHEHYDHNNIKALKGDPFLINSPGEYEIKGIKVNGIESFHDNEQGAKRGLNTIYVIEMEGIRLAHAGDFGQDSLDEFQLDKMGNIDILMIPVGGHFTIGAKKAADILKQVEPKIAIPMHYKLPKLTIKELEGVDKFLKEMGKEDIKSEEKLTIKAKDFQEELEKTEIVVMKI